MLKMQTKTVRMIHHLQKKRRTYFYRRQQFENEYIYSILGSFVTHRSRKDLIDKELSKKKDQNEPFSASKDQPTVSSTQSTNNIVSTLNQLQSKHSQRRSSQVTEETTTNYPESYHAQFDES